MSIVPANLSQKLAILGNLSVLMRPRTIGAFTAHGSRLTVQGLRLIVCCVLMAGGALFFAGAASANPAERAAFLDGMKRGLESNPFREAMTAIFEKDETSYEQLKPVLATRDFVRIRQASGAILADRLHGFMSRMDDAQIAQILSLQARMLIAAYAENPSLCTGMMSGADATPARTPALRDAIHTYSTTLANVIRQIDFVRTPVRQKPTSAQVERLFATLAPDVVAAFRRSTDEASQCLFEARLRERVGTLPLERQALAARFLLFQ